MEFSYYIKYNNEYFKDENPLYFKEPVYYHGADAMKKFVSMLKEDTIKIEKFIIEKEDKYEDIKSMIDFNEHHYKRSNKWHICEKEISPEHVKVIDHCHLTGKYRDSAQNDCNLNYKITSFIPTIIHNLSGYDAHLFIKELGFDDSRLDVIPNN
ncbi:hypothetical protein AVEN_146945-1 [Araneus ventricosus]|uniref:DNA-directed DNA polymerase n=1 Tax=Araneus ventricosus TaxID=182803 RepID=A0A4Y2M261_ARAVE|nr:hypothetical protein AVEN_146945-1 [Araneus ventricosus]